MSIDQRLLLVTATAASNLAFHVYHTRFFFGARHSANRIAISESRDLLCIIFHNLHGYDRARYATKARNAIRETLDQLKDMHEFTV